MNYFFTQTRVSSALRSECFFETPNGLSSGSVSLVQTPRVEPPPVTSAPLPSPSEISRDKEHLKNLGKRKQDNEIKKLTNAVAMSSLNLIRTTLLKLVNLESTDHRLLMFLLTFEEDLFQGTPALFSLLFLGLLSLPPLQNHLKLWFTTHHQPSVPPKEPKQKPPTLEIKVPL